MSPEPERETLRQRRERIFVRRRAPRRGVALAVAAAGVLVVVAAAFWVFHRSTPRSTVVAEVPLIRADDQPTRKRPADPGGMTVPDQDSIVLNRSEPKVEQLLPPPEAPLPRPTPSEPPADTPQPVTPSPRAAEPVPPPPTPEPEPSVAAATPPAPAPAIPEQTARAAAPPPPAPAAGKGYRLQLGSVRTPEGAKHEWERLQRENSDLLGKLGYSPARVDLGDRGIFYRIQAGPLAGAAAAERTCDELKRRGIGCILVKP
jgi:hypothetical protein